LIGGRYAGPKKTQLMRIPKVRASALGVTARISEQNAALWEKFKYVFV